MIRCWLGIKHAACNIIRMYMRRSNVLQTKCGFNSHSIEAIFSHFNYCEYLAMLTSLQHEFVVCKQKTSNIVSFMIFTGFLFILNVIQPHPTAMLIVVFIVLYLHVCHHAGIRMANTIPWVAGVYRRQHHLTKRRRANIIDYLIDGDPTARGRIRNRHRVGTSPAP